MLETAKPPILGHVRSEEPKPEAQRAGRGWRLGEGEAIKGKARVSCLGGLSPGHGERGSASL